MCRQAILGIFSNRQNNCHCQLVAVYISYCGDFFFRIYCLKFWYLATITNATNCQVCDSFSISGHCLQLLAIFKTVEK